MTIVNLSMKERTVTSLYDDKGDFPWGDVVYRENGDLFNWVVEDPDTGTSITIPLITPSNEFRTFVAHKHPPVVVTSDKFSYNENRHIVQVEPIGLETDGELYMLLENGTGVHVGTVRDLGFGWIYGIEPKGAYWDYVGYGWGSNKGDTYIPMKLLRTECDVNTHEVKKTLQYFTRSEDGKVLTHNLWEFSTVKGLSVLDMSSIDRDNFLKYMSDQILSTVKGWSAQNTPLPVTVCEHCGSDGGV